MKSAYIESTADQSVYYPAGRRNHAGLQSSHQV